MAKASEQARQIREMWSMYQSSRVLLTANNYRVFDRLEKPASAAAMAKKLKTDRRATEILLDALTGLGLLKKGTKGYRNSPLSSRFLVSGKQHYQGDIIRHADALWDSWSRLDRVVKTGTPAGRRRKHEAFILGMHNLASFRAGDVIREAGISGVRTALDLGGGPGTYALEMSRRGIDVTLFDLPETISIARKVVRQARGRKGTIRFRAGDFLRDDLGSGYDLIFISQILHAYSEKDNMTLLRKCLRALNTGGSVVIQEFLISEDRTRPLWGSLFAVNMLVNTSGGRSYTPHELRAWLLKTGFSGIRKKAMGDVVLVSGVK